MSKVVTLGDIAQVVDCEHKTAPAVAPELAYAYSIGTPALRGADIDFSQAKPVSRETYAAWSRRAELRRGDVILAREAPVGGVGFVDGSKKVCLGQRTVLVRTNTELADPRFMFYLLQSPGPQTWMEMHSEGSTVKHLNVADVRRVALGLLPSLDEQRRIAGVLGALDDLIEVNRKLADDCEALAQALAATSPRLTALSSFARWGGLDAITPSGQVDHYSLPAFDSGRAPERALGASIKSNKQKIDRSCVLVSRLNPHIPRVWMVYPEGDVTSVASTEFVPLFGSDVPTELVYAVCSSPEYLRQMNGLVTGTTGSHQRIDKSSLVDVSVPDVRALASSASGAVVALVRQAHAARVEMRELAATRDELLPLLMSGCVQVGDVAA